MGTAPAWHEQEVVEQNVALQQRSFLSISVWGVWFGEESSGEASSLCYDSLSCDPPLYQQALVFSLFRSLF